MTQQQLDHFEQNGWVLVDNFIPNEMAAAIRSEILSKRNEGELKKAGIGRNDNFQLDQNRRGDFIEWIDSALSSESTIFFLTQLQELIRELNRSFYLGISDHEAHLTYYPEGTRYEKHVDRHKSGSARRVSFVFYLNENWVPDHGGELIIYQSTESSESVQPVFNRLAIFLSEMEHEVSLTHQPRMSITGWMLNRGL